MTAGRVTPCVSQQVVQGDTKRQMMAETQTMRFPRLRTVDRVLQTWRYNLQSSPLLLMKEMVETMSYPVP